MSSLRSRDLRVITCFLEHLKMSWRVLTKKRTEDPKKRLEDNIAVTNKYLYMSSFRGHRGTYRLWTRRSSTELTCFDNEIKDYKKNFILLEDNIAMTKKVIHVLTYGPWTRRSSTELTCFDNEIKGSKKSFILPEDNIATWPKRFIHVLVSIEALTGYEPVALPLS
jgi:hypothetical protein